ncbi:flagellar hook protein FlgE [Psychromonas sp. 14N.309.X.WAT.B.A12]|uniref:flagellar hook protein FlgE n=1 Tax=unclassified Psychromonas TaxID=2614957 RepID=UPI0025B0FE6A|nr:flagellar hook protein FlgE [Psychromonas sp. 14N.309.X.WAT.B.A12]MDN2663971.1 flagellar hook protein FlgE [Psychromonas sp. 14N.309.X.WAT.B.A12]
MSFNIALSGISAAQTDLDATANNISNVSTAGFKESRAEFDSVYANSLFTNSATKVGDGAAVSAVAQQFHQGSLKFTDNPLDLAITGSGFFATAPGLDDNNVNYTRSGTFKLNSENYVVDNSGNYLQAFPVNPDGSSSSLSLATTQPIKIPETAGTPVKTDAVSISLNLPAGDEEKPLADFDPSDPDTYNNATSVTIYDSLGEPHVLNTYYVKPENGSADGTNQWVSFVTVDNKPVDSVEAANYFQDANGDGAFDDAIGTSASYTDADGVVHNGIVLNFDENGGYVDSSPEVLAFENLGVDGADVLSAGADGTQAITLEFEEPTQFASAFQVTGLEQNGLTVGRLTGIEIGSDGLVQVSYSNGTSDPLARVAMVRFRNEQGLSQTGSNWTESQSSGGPLTGEAGSGTFGSISSGALEQSNVDLTTELVDLISAQRNFQANSRSLEISSSLQETILQIR